MALRLCLNLFLGSSLPSRQSITLGDQLVLIQAPSEYMGRLTKEPGPDWRAARVDCEQTSRGPTSYPPRQIAPWQHICCHRQRILFRRTCRYVRISAETAARMAEISPGSPQSACFSRVKQQRSAQQYVIA